MAQISMKYVVAAPSNDSGGYDAGMVIGRALSADISTTTNPADFWTDDAIEGTVNQYGGGTIALNINHLTYQAQSLLLGHSTGNTGTDITGDLTANINDQGAYVGVGFCSEVFRNAKYLWRAIWLTRVKFSDPNETINTKNGTVAFQTPTINGNISGDSNGDWKIETTVVTEDEARTWLNTKANITPAVQVPGAPVNLQADPKDSEVDLSWTAPSNAAAAQITGYEASSDAGTTWIAADTDTTHAFTGLTNDQQYTFSVRAKNSAGAGTAASVTATPVTTP